MSVRVGGERERKMSSASSLLLAREFKDLKENPRSNYFQVYSKSSFEGRGKEEGSKVRFVLTNANLCRACRFTKG